MADTDRAADLERLDDARHVLGEGSHAVRQSLYAVYVTVLLALTYGLTVARALFLTADPAGLRAQLLSWPALLVLLVTVLLLVWVARRAGRTRGPVVPPLPWIDVVVPSAVDRALSLRRWWGLALLGALTGGVVLGGVLGGGLWFAHVGGPLWLAAGIAVAVVVALLVLVGWLVGQVSLAPPPPGATGFGPRTALRRLRIDDLRQHATRSTRLGGAVLAADLRAVRLEVATPVTRGRSRRLRSGRPLVVVARRDLLGLRRTPGGLASGAVLTAVGAVVVGWSVGSSGVPALFPCLAMLACYLGFGAWAEGLRLEGDNAGTPPLIGLDATQEARAHLVAPVALFVVVAGVVGLATALVTGTAGWAGGIRAGLWSVPLAVVLAGCHLVAAFRGTPPSALTGLRSPAGLALWLGLPMVVAALVGGLTTAAVAQGTGTPWVVATALGGAVVAIGFTRARAVADAHRV